MKIEKNALTLHELILCKQGVHVLLVYIYNPLVSVYPCSATVCYSSGHPQKKLSAKQEVIWSIWGGASHTTGQRVRNLAANVISVEWQATTLSDMCPKEICWDRRGAIWDNILTWSGHTGVTIKYITITNWYNITIIYDNIYIAVRYAL